MDDTIEQYLNSDHFYNVLDDAASQVFKGKGEERHGLGTPLGSQPWKVITDNVGTGFVIGQAMKKLLELKAFNPIGDKYSSWRREALGVIVYTVMAIMYNDMLNGLKEAENKLAELDV